MPCTPGGTGALRCILPICLSTYLSICLFILVCREIICKLESCLLKILHRVGGSGTSSKGSCMSKAWNKMH